MREMFEIVGIRPLEQRYHLSDKIELAEHALEEDCPLRLQVPKLVKGKQVYTNHLPVNRQFIYGMRQVVKSAEMQG